MSWSIAEVALMSGVSSRTLRHYHAIGLLAPAWVADNGWRHYEQHQLLRLQRILLLRNLGLGLRTVAEILEVDDREGTVAALRRHRGWLGAEQERLGLLVRTIDRTIEDLQEGSMMTTEMMFEGFAHNPYEAEARERWGDDAVDASVARTKACSPADADKALNGYRRVHEGLAQLLAAGLAADDDRVQALIELHYGVTSYFWAPDAEAYQGLGQMYVDDERFRAGIGKGDDDLVAYLRDAMVIYAEARLK